MSNCQQKRAKLADRRICPLHAKEGTTWTIWNTEPVTSAATGRRTLPWKLPRFWRGKWDQMGHFLKDYIWPWNAFHVATALLYWVFVIPDVEVMKMISWGWALYLLAVNAIGIFLLYGAIELFFYVKRRQETRFKYNAKFPSENPSDVFWFKSQNLDNFLRSFFVGIPIWTVVEVVMLWCFANGYHVFGWLDGRTAGSG